MTASDETILEVLAEHDVALPPKPLSVNIDRAGGSVSYSTVKRRLDVLHDRDLIQLYREEGSYYEITDLGERFLEGNVDRTELEE